MFRWIIHYTDAHLLYRVITETVPAVAWLFTHTKISKWCSNAVHICVYQDNVFNVFQ